MSKLHIIIMENQIEGFPQEVIDKMLERQVEQGNKRDVNEFKACRLNGFVWSKTPENHTFWHQVICHENFDLFFERYPKPLYPKVMLVSDYESPHENWHQRVVFMEKCGMFLAWEEAETLEDAQNKTKVWSWKYAKDLPKVEPVKEYTLEEIAKALGKPVESIRVKK